MLLARTSVASSTDEGPELICAVAPDGKFTAEAPEYCRGRWVKDCDKDIIRDLKQRGLLFHQEQYPARLSVLLAGRRGSADPVSAAELVHPHHRSSRTQMLANNQQINWLPEHIKDGRFGNFLETNVDWALSRERYWGTPLPIWVCEKTGKMEAVASYAELLTKPGVTGDRSLGRRRKQANPEAARRSAGSQAVHRRGHLRLAVRPRRADAARARSDRLLVRLGRDAVCPVGLSARRAGRDEPRISRAVSGRLHQRGARSDPRLVLQPVGDQHAAVRRRESKDPDRPLPFRIRSATASCWG